LYGGGLRVANFAVNNSSTAGTVFFGEESVVVGPYAKLELTSVPSYWTRNIQLVKGLVRNRKANKPTDKPSEGAGSGGSGEGVNNG
jgi:hypothetical protein